MGFKSGRISIHAPAWGATSGDQGVDVLAEFQSTHPHGVRQDDPDYDPDISQISIHAPAWGATPGAVHARLDRKISIHAPAWGATASAQAISRSVGNFNPRTRMGCDSL